MSEAFESILGVILLLVMVFIGHGTIKAWVAL